MSIKLKKIQQSTTAFEFAEGLHGKGKAGMHSFFMEESMGLTTTQFCNKNGRTAGRARVALDGSSSSKTTHNTPQNVNNN